MAVWINLMHIQIFKRNKDQGTGNGIALASLARRRQPMEKQRGGEILTLDSTRNLLATAEEPSWRPRARLDSSAETSGSA